MREHGKNPVFVHATNSDDPFKSLVSTNGIYNVSFEDWDHDGLIDLFSNTTYYKNIGTKKRPEFALSSDNKPIFQNEPERSIYLHSASLGRYK